MSEDPKPLRPFQLNGSRIVLLVLGVVLLAIIASTLLGGLSNYQQLREASDAAKSAAP